MLNAGVMDLFFFLCRLTSAALMLAALIYILRAIGTVVYALWDARKQPPLPSEMDNPNSRPAWNPLKPWNHRAWF